jgi:hypothetical protein
MTDKRETDLLAYILSGFVIAISGIAVGVASTNSNANTSSGGIGISPAVSAPDSSAVAPDATAALTEDHGTLTAVRRGQ